MGYRDKVSDHVDIDEGLSEISDEAHEIEVEYQKQLNAEKADDIEASARAHKNVVEGRHPFTEEELTLTDWLIKLDDIQATPDQRRLYEEAKQEVESSRHEFIDDYYGDDFDRHPEGDYHT